MYDIYVYLAIIIGVIVRVYLMKGKFVLPTWYKIGKDVSFNLGSLSSIIIGVVAALILIESNPGMLAASSVPTWFIAGITAYSSPQVVDAIITKGTRIKNNSDAVFEDIESEDDIAQDSEIPNTISENDEEGA